MNFSIFEKVQLDRKFYTFLKAEVLLRTMVQLFLKLFIRNIQKTAPECDQVWYFGLFDPDF